MTDEEGAWRLDNWGHFSRADALWVAFPRPVLSSASARLRPPQGLGGGMILNTLSHKSVLLS